MIQALKDDNSNVRSKVVYALGEFSTGANEAVPALIQTLRDEDRIVRRAAKGALEMIGTPEALEAIEDSLS
jgi:HEAT repeat protein